MFFIAIARKEHNIYIPLINDHIYSTKEIIFTSIISKYSQSNADIKHIWDKIKHQVKSHTNKLINFTTFNI